MASLNSVSLIGNLTREPELRVTPSGTSVANLGLAINRRWKDKDGNKHEVTTFLRVTAWEGLADTCAKYLRKGSCVFVTGRLQSRSWEGDDGKKNTALDVVADDVQFLDAPGGRGERTDQAGRDYPDAVAPEDGGGI